MSAHRWLAKVHPAVDVLATIYAMDQAAPTVMLGSGVLGVSLVGVEHRQSIPDDSFPLVVVAPT